MRFGGPRLLEIDGWFRRSSIERWFGARLAPSASAAIALGTLATSGSGSDALSLAARRILVFAAVADSGSDALALNAKRALSLSEGASGSDALSISARRALALIDAASGSDAAVVAAKRALSLAAAGTGSDTLALMARRAIVGASTATGTDAVVLAAMRALAITDSGTGSDAAAPHAARPIAASDAGSGSDTATLSGDSAPAPTLVLTSSGSASDGLSLSARRALVLATSCSSWNDVELSGSSRIAGPPTIWSAQRKLDEVRRRQLAIDRANAAADTPLPAPPPPPPAVARPAGDHDSAASPLAPVPVVGAIDTARGALADESAPSNEEAKSHTPTAEDPNADLPSAVRSSDPAAAPDAARLDRPQAVVVPQNIAIVAENIAPVAQNIAIVAPSPALLPDLAATSASATPDSVSSKQIAGVPIVVVSPEIAASLGLSDDELVAVLLAITTPAPSRRLTRAPAASGV